MKHSVSILPPSLWCCFWFNMIIKKSLRLINDMHNLTLNDLVRSVIEEKKKQTECWSETIESIMTCTFPFVGCRFTYTFECIKTKKTHNLRFSWKMENLNESQRNEVLSMIHELVLKAAKHIFLLNKCHLRGLKNIIGILLYLVQWV